MILTILVLLSVTTFIVSGVVMVGSTTMGNPYSKTATVSAWIFLGSGGWLMLLFLAGLWLTAINTGVTP